MTEGTLASAVALPEQDPLPSSPDASLKRRKSSITDADLDPNSKRRRLSSQDENKNPQPDADRKPSSPDTGDRRQDRKPGRQAGGRDEERKRGQRLFGALLGTLSQSSNSAAQKRRADIERKQQDKLKLQEEEYGELKKKRREERITVRKKEQRLYEEESMHTRHSNLRAMAHFLKTKTEPALYYKPWQLRSEDEAILRDQMEEAEAIISREIAEFQARHPPQEEGESKEQKDQTQAENTEQAPPSETDSKEPRGTTPETVDAEIQHDRGSEVAPADAMSNTGTTVTVNNDQSDDHREAEDNGGEVVEEDKEDTVIY